MSQLIELDDETDAPEPQSHDEASPSADGDASSRAGSGSSVRKRLSDRTIGLPQMAMGVTAAGLVAAVGVLGYVAADQSSQMDAMRSAAADGSHAEQVALDYATGAANMNFKDLPAWNTALTAHTTPELTAKLKEAASSMEQVIVPLQWTSTARPIAASVKSHNGDVYVVNAFVAVTTKNAQAPDGVQSTASYTVTLDSAQDWQITDVGGVDGALAPK
ncbi:hypothetical protein [Gordonia sp. NPDC003376]